MSQGRLRRQYPDTGQVFRYQVEGQGSLARIDLGEGAFDLSVITTVAGKPTRTGEGWCATASGQRHRFAYAWVGDELHLWLDGNLFIYRREAARRRDRGQAQSGVGDILAPMPGTVLEVRVQPGDRVERDQTVVIMESMKMELVITVPGPGVVRRGSVQSGDQVDKGMRLLELGEEPESTEL